MEDVKQLTEIARDHGIADGLSSQRVADDRAKSFQTLRSERYLHLSGRLAASRRPGGLAGRKKQVRIQDGEFR